MVVQGHLIYRHHYLGRKAEIVVVFSLLISTRLLDIPCFILMEIHRLGSSYTRCNGIIWYSRQPVTPAWGMLNGRQRVHVKAVQLGVDHIYIVFIFVYRLTQIFLLDLSCVKHSTNWSYWEQ